MESKETLLIVDERYDFLNLIEVIIESEFEINILKAVSNSEATNILQNRKDIKAIISRPRPFLDSDKRDENPYSYNMDNAKVPFISYCNELKSDEINKLKEDNQYNAYLDNPLDEQRLYNTLQNLLHIRGQSFRIENQGEDISLKRIKLTTLGMFSNLSYDLYLKLGNGEKFIQVGRKGNDDLSSILEHYKQKGVEHLYLKEDDYSRYLDTAKEIINQNTQERAGVGTQKFTTVEIFDFAFEISREQLNTVGVTRMQEEVVHSAMKDLIVDLKEDKVLYSMIKDFFNSKNYMADHSLLIIYLSSMILNKLGWSNEQTLKQVVYAGFFHDMFVPEELARVKDLNTLEFDTDRSHVLKHITKAAKVLEGIKGLNNDAHKMIMDHHERPDGNGFPHGLTANQLPPLSSVFIISHHIVDYLYDVKFDTLNLAAFIQDMQGVWDQGNFKRIYTCARSLLLD